MASGYSFFAIGLLTPRGYCANQFSPRAQTGSHTIILLTGICIAAF